MIFFPSVKNDEWKTALKLTQRCLIYGWATKSAAIEINKKISAAQLGSKHDNTMNKSRQQSTRQKRKMNTLADANYFYTEKWTMCTHFWVPIPALIQADFCIDEQWTKGGNQAQGRKERWTHWQIQIIFTQRNQQCAQIFGYLYQP